MIRRLLPILAALAALGAVAGCGSKISHRQLATGQMCVHKANLQKLSQDLASADPSAETVSELTNTAGILSGYAAALTKSGKAVVGPQISTFENAIARMVRDVRPLDPAASAASIAPQVRADTAGIQRAVDGIYAKLSCR